MENTPNTTAPTAVAAYSFHGLGRLIAALCIALLPARALAVDATIWAELGRVRTLEARFTQVQTRAILKAPLTSEGEVRFARPDTLSWTVTTPARSTFSLAGSVAKMEYPDLGLKETIDLAAVPDANRLATSLMVWLRADAVAVERDFSVAYGATTATLTPRDPRLAALLARMELDFAPDPWRVRTVRLWEPDGDRVEIRFDAVKLDGQPVGGG